MADSYSRVAGRFWIDTKGWGERNQRVALYLLTNRNRTMEGLYYLPLGYLCEDLGLSPKQAQDAITYIEGEGMVAYDGQAQVVFLPKALLHGAPKTEMHIRGAMRRLSEVRASRHWSAFLAACELHANGLANAIRVAWPDPLESSFSYSLSTPPQPPASGGSPNGLALVVDDPAPLKPSSGRQRDLDAYNQAMAGWASAHFPDAHLTAVAAAVVEAGGSTTPVTATDVERWAVANGSVWTDQLGLPDVAA